MTDGNDGTVLVRSTIHLPEIGRNAVVRVDPSRPYIAGALARGYLVPVEEAEPVAPTVEPADDGTHADALVEADDAAQADAQLALERVEAVDDTES